MRIAEHDVGNGAPCFVIAEAGVNHNGDVGLAHALVDAAADAAADAVKFQTFSPERLASSGAPLAEYQEQAGERADQRQMLARLALDVAAHRELKTHAEARGLVFLSSPFDERSADMLDGLGVAAFKIASGEVTNHPLLAHVARKGRPIILSTGMCDVVEVTAAVNVIRDAGDPPLALLHCVSSYPADRADANVRAIVTLTRMFSVPVGWSDHTDGDEAAMAAVALGACILERHLTTDCSLPGPDHRASLEPDAFAALVRRIRALESTLGDGEKRARPCERAIAAVARKSLHWATSLPVGHLMASTDVVALRPGTGVSPARLTELVGRRLARAVRAQAMLRDEDLEATL